MKTLSRSVLRALTLACILLGLFGIYIALILLNGEFSSNIVFAGTMLAEASEWAYLGIELLAIFAAYAFLLLSLFTDGVRGGLWTVLAYLIATLLRHAVLLWLGFGEMWAETSNLVLELLQFGLVFAVCYVSVMRFDRTYAVMKSGAEHLDRPCPDRFTLVYPHIKQPLKADAIKRGALASAAVLVVFRVLGRLIYDFHYGMPTDIIDALWMLLYYSTDVLIGVGGYFLVLWVIRTLSRRKA